MVDKHLLNNIMIKRIRLMIKDKMKKIRPQIRSNNLLIDQRRLLNLQNNQIAPQIKPRLPPQIPLKLQFQKVTVLINLKFMIQRNQSMVWQEYKK